MKNIISLIVCLVSVISVPSVGAAADVSVNINIGAPPPLTFAAPPDVVVVPSGTSDVYLVPNTVGLYFYGGYWYRFHGGYWFRASLYSGPWNGISVSLVPADVVVIPPEYILSLPPGYHRIHYGDFHGHWREWGRNHYWNKQAWYRDHAAHHWGGRDFHRPPEAHHGRDSHRDGDVHKSTHTGGDVRKPPVHAGGNEHKSTVHSGGGVRKSTPQGSGDMHKSSGHPAEEINKSPVHTGGDVHKSPGWDHK